MGGFRDKEQYGDRKRPGMGQQGTKVQLFAGEWITNLNYNNFCNKLHDGKHMMLILQG
jgi:hypothetical protein